ncbi:MAG: hypothetical protein R2799_07000 [Crocinitomicaceae bacterium]
MKQFLLLFTFSFYFGFSFSQSHSGSEIAERNPTIYDYSGTGVELHIVAGESTIWGVCDIDGKQDSIKFGSFLMNDIAIYLKNGNIIQGKTKTFDELSLKLVNKVYKKLENLELKLVNKDKSRNLLAADQTKYTEESGIAIYQIDDNTIQFYVFWQERKNLNVSSNFQSFIGTAKKSGSNGVYKSLDYLVPEMPELNATLFIDVKKDQIDFWVDTDIPTQRGGLEKNEKLTFK